MPAFRYGPVMLVALAATAVAADPIRLSDEDLYFVARPVYKGAGMCGFQIRGNHRSREIPRSEWDLNIDKIVAGDLQVDGITAGAFDVLTSDRKTARKPRSPIVSMSFAVKGDSQIIATRIVGAPSADNGVKGMMEPEPAARLFTALLNGKEIQISLSYQDGTSEALQIHGLVDRRKFGRGKNNLLDECLHGRAPFSNIAEPVP
jgi:hypothetical protein